MVRNTEQDYELLLFCLCALEFSKKKFPDLGPTLDPKP